MMRVEVIKMRILYILLLLMFMPMMVYAYNVSDLKAYYTMDSITNINNSVSILSEDVGSFDMTLYDTALSPNINSKVTSTFSGKIGNGMYVSNCYQNNCAIFTNKSADILNFNSSWSINYWIKRTTNGFNSFFEMYNYPNNLSIDTFSSSNNYYLCQQACTPDIIQIQGELRGGAQTTYNDVLSGYVPVNNTWYMITMTYDNVTRKVQTYINNDVSYNIAGDTVNATSNNDTIVANYTKIELSLDFQIIDEISIWSETLSPDDVKQLFNNDAGLSYTEILALENSSPYVDNTTFYYNVCLPNLNGTFYLCSIANATGTTVTCVNPQNITQCNASCIDTQAYYQSISHPTIVLPPFNNYNGSCTICNNSCNVNLLRTCYNDFIVQICQINDLGCYYLSTFNVCSGGQKCISGTCTFGGNSTSLTGNPTDDFLSGQGLSPNTKYLVVLIIILATIIGFTGAGFAMGASVAGFAVGVIVGFFELIIATLLGWISAWVLIVLIILSILCLIFIVIGRSG